MIKFKAGYERLKMIEGYPQSVIKQETQFFRADRAFAMLHGGPIIRDFLENLPKEWQSERLVIDSRVHMLMPGFYPCIPGWHLDDVPRTRRDGQPDHTNPRYFSKHIMMIAGDASRTAFLRGEVELEDAQEYTGNVYAIWHEKIEEMVRANPNILRVEQVRENELIEFGWGSFHKGMPATKRGWRLFVRATKYTELENRNEIRTQTQVYATTEGAGW